MDMQRLEAQLLISEGSPPRTYLDTKGILTGGIGHNLVAKPEAGFDRVGVLVPDDVRSRWFAADIETAMAELDVHLPWWRELDDVRQNAIIDLTFNMGISGLLTFKNTLAALERGDYATAAAGIRNSQYARDVGPRRSGHIAGMIEMGRW